MRKPGLTNPRRSTVVVAILILLGVSWRHRVDAAPPVPGESASLKPAKSPGHRGPACVADGREFAEEVWAKVGERTCLKCHHPKGDARESAFILQPTTRNTGALVRNRAAFLRMAAGMNNGQSRLLLKVQGKLDHGGGAVLKPGSTGYLILSRFVRRNSAKPTLRSLVADNNAPPFFAGIRMMPPRRLLRRVTLSLAARLPSRQEYAAVEKGGLKAIAGILDGLMKEEAFYERLQEAFNDILLTRGYDGVAEGALSYEHFKNRLWYQQRDPNKGRKKSDRLPYSHPKMIAYTRLVREYREAMRREPLELITHIVRNDRPFTEIVTADYTMVSPYTARGYGVFETVRKKFKNSDDPFEFIPTKIPALRHRNGRAHQKTPTGFFPHSGLLTSFQYLKRYPTTETNRNRLRVRMYFQHFLGVDIMQLAPRVNDAAAITAKYEIPTMQATDCTVCHKVIDPVAGLYQDFYVVDGKGIYGPRKQGWYQDMFPPGLENERLPDDQRWRSVQWLGKRTARDPRFAVAMVQHVWYILMGRQVLDPPDDIDDPLFVAKRRAYVEQRRVIEETAARFAASGFNLKVVFKELVASKFYQVDGLSANVTDARRRAELDDLGLVRLLTPEQLERKLTALFGRKWGRLVHRESKFKILYGGIDSKEVTERNTDPSGAMGAIQRIMANDVACRNVAADFSLKPHDRRLFPAIELDDVPGNGAETDAKIRRAIVHLHEFLLGRTRSIDHPEVERTWRLFAGIVSDAKSTKGLDKRGSYHCGRVDGKRLDDPHYTLRAWRGVVTYLLRQHEFLYE